VNEGVRTGVGGWGRGTYILIEGSAKRRTSTKKSWVGKGQKFKRPAKPEEMTRTLGEEGNKGYVRSDLKRVVNKQRGGENNLYLYRSRLHHLPTYRDDFRVTRVLHCETDSANDKRMKSVRNAHQKLCKKDRGGSSGFRDEHSRNFTALYIKKRNRCSITIGRKFAGGCDGMGGRF